MTRTYQPGVQAMLGCLAIVATTEVEPLGARVSFSLGYGLELMPCGGWNSCRTALAQAKDGQRVPSILGEDVHHATHKEVALLRQERDVAFEAIEFRRVVVKKEAASSEGRGVKSLPGWKG